MNLKPKAIFIEIGANDLKDVNEANAMMLEKRLLENYYKIIDMALKDGGGLRIFIISILPVLKNPSRNSSIINVNSALKEFSGRHEAVVYIDCFEAFYDKKHGAAKEAYMIGPNSAHLNDIGYRRWGSLLLEFVTLLK